MAFLTNTLNPAVTTHAELNFWAIGLFFMGSCLIVGLAGVQFLQGSNPPRSSLTALRELGNKSLKIDLPRYGGGKPQLSRLGIFRSILALIMSFAILVITVELIRHFELDKRFHSEGVETLGMVDESSPKTSSDKKLVRFEILYHFQRGDQNFVGKTTVSKVQPTLAIIYLASDPRVNRPASQRDLPRFLIFPALIFLIFPIQIFVKLYKDYKLLKNGRFTSGIVVEVKRGRRKHYVWYDFVDNQETVRRGTSWVPRFRNDRSPVTICFLPDRPEVNSIYQAMTWRV